MNSFSDLIARLGGPGDVAPIIGAKVDAVRKMSERNSVPPQYWQALIDAARGKRMSGVTFASLTRLKGTRKPYTRSAKRDNLSTVDAVPKGTRRSAAGRQQAA